MKRSSRLFRAFGPAALVLGVACSPRPPESPRPEAAKTVSEDFFERGVRAFHEGDSVRAEQYIAVAVEQGYDEGRALPWLLRACLRNARLRSALGYAEPYLRRHPEADELRLLVATLRLSLGQKTTALRHARHLLRREPNNAEAHYVAGLAEPDRSAVATLHFNEYLRLTPVGEHASEVEDLLAEWRESALEPRFQQHTTESPHDPQ